MGAHGGMHPPHTHDTCASKSKSKHTHPHTHSPLISHVHAQGAEVHSLLLNPLTDQPLAAPRLTNLVLSRLDLRGSFFAPLAACSSLRSLVMRSVDFEGRKVTASLTARPGRPPRARSGAH